MKTALLTVAILEVSTLGGNTARGGTTDDTGLWTGTVVTEATVHEGGGYHPCKTTIRVRLREIGRSRLAGGDRVDLRSEGTTYDVEMAVHGLVECTGKGSQTVSDTAAQSAILRGPKSSPYHLILSRAFFSFTCGGRRLLGEKSLGRAVAIGREPEITTFDPSNLETADPQVRYLEQNGTRMSGSFTTTRQLDAGPPWPRNLYTYDYKVAWEICQGGSYCSK